MSIFFKALLIALALVGPLTWLVVVNFAPRRQHDSDALSVRLWLYAPIWVSLLVVVSAMAPAVLTGLIMGVDHCVSHSSHHHHLCIWHAASHAHRSSAMLIPLVVALPSLLLVAATGRRIFRERRLVGALLNTSRPSEFDGVRLLDQEQPIALTVGWTQPTVLLSTGLIERLSAESLDAILAHERAHARRRDTMLAAADRFAASILPDLVSLPLLQRLHLLRELACDSEAAQNGRPLVVARALTDVARLRTSNASCCGAAVEPRVQNLLSTGDVRSRPRVLPTAFVIASLATIGAWPVHNVIEHLLNFLLH